MLKVFALALALVVGAAQADTSLHTDLPLSYLNDFTVIDRTKGEIGKISQIDDYAGNIVITVLYQSKEVLIPLSDSIIDEIDEPQKILRLDVPEGLIDLYLE